MKKPNVRASLLAVKTVLLDNKELVDLFQSAITIFAIIVAGVWTYGLFVATRETRPHLNVHHSVVSKIIAPGVAWMHLTVVLENTGESLVSLRSADVRVQKVVPLDASLQKSLGAGKNLVPENEYLVPWPLLRHYVAKLDLEIEPKESDNVDFDFVLPTAARTVRIYTYLENVEKASRQIGWHLDTIYDIPDELSTDSANRSAADASGSLVSRSVRGSSPKSAAGARTAPANQ